MNVANSFIQSFMTHCANPKSDHDYRPILQYLVEDLLNMLNQPEWPAAELLLQIIVKQLIQTSVKKTESSDPLKLLRYNS